MGICGHGSDLTYSGLASGYVSGVTHALQYGSGQLLHIDISCISVSATQITSFLCVAVCVLLSAHLCSSSDCVEEAGARHGAYVQRKQGPFTVQQATDKLRDRTRWCAFYSHTIADTMLLYVMWVRSRSAHQYCYL